MPDTLEEMAQEADHILIGRVAGVDMVDGHGKPITDPEARTGPSLDNTIRLLIKVDEVLVSNASEVQDVRPLKDKDAALRLHASSHP